MMGGLNILSCFKGRLRRRRSPCLGDIGGSERGFAVDKIRKLVISYQDGTPRRLWFPEDGYLAAELGHVGLMRELKGVFRYPRDVMDRAAKDGLVDVVGFLWEEGYGCTTEAMDGAAKAGHIDTVIWLHKHSNAGATKAAMDWAASNGHLSVVEWLHRNRQEGCTVSAMNWAAQNGHLDVVTWLHKNRKEGCTTAAFDRAAMNNHVDVVMWLVMNRAEGGTEKALRCSITRGHTQLVGLLSTPKCGSLPQDTMVTKYVSPSRTWSSWSTWSISSPGSAKCWPGSPADSWQTSEARSPDLLAGSKRTNFGCSKFAMDKAAQGGHLEVLKLLHSQGHSCTTRAMDWAAAFGQLEVVQWLSQNRPEGCTRDAMDHAAANGHLDTVIWLHQNRSEGCTHHALIDAAGNGHIETVKWLHLNRREGCGRKAMDDAATNGHLEVVKWLHYNRSEGCSREAMEGAARNGHLGLVAFLFYIGAVCTSTAIHLAHVHGHEDVVRYIHGQEVETGIISAQPDALVREEVQMIDEKKRREMDVMKETERRRLPAVSGDRNAGKRNRQASKSMPLIFGRDGKPVLRPIDTLG